VLAAYAAHELRGEITLQLALASIALAEPNADTIALRQMAERIVASCKQQEQLIEALLTLAQGEYGELEREPVDLAATAADALRGYDHHPLRRVVTLRPAVTVGHPKLIERLAANLIENAILHNIPNGRIDLATHTTADRAVLTIANSGPAIPAGEVARLFRPFQRLRSRPDRAAHGVGLGLAIVETIADAHNATIHAEPRTGGGLRIDIGFPQFAAPANSGRNSM
jgi:signal transduction histidine kinase